MKKTVLAVLVVALIFSTFAACDIIKGAESEVVSDVSSAVSSEISNIASSESSNSGSEVEITVDTPQPIKVGDEIKVNLVIKNNSENAIVYVQGSSSMPYPESLKIEMTDGRLRALTPIAMTKDYQITPLNPGETKGYEVSFEIAQDAGIEAGKYVGKATLEYVDTGEIEITEGTDLSVILETAEKSTLISEFTINVE